MTRRLAGVESAERSFLLALCSPLTALEAGCSQRFLGGSAWAVPATTGLSPLWKPPWPRAWSQNRDPKESPPVRPCPPTPKEGFKAEAGGSSERTHLKSQPLRGRSSLKRAGVRPGQGWSWQEPRGGRKQETIKEESNPGLGLAQATGACRLSSGWESGGLLGGMEFLFSSLQHCGLGRVRVGVGVGAEAPLKALTPLTVLPRSSKIITVLPL